MKIFSFIWSIFIDIYNTDMRKIKDIAIAESGDSDFKERLETKNAKSWLKSVSAFANGIGGTLYFGVEDGTRKVIGIENIQTVISKITELIVARITPRPTFECIPLEREGKDVLVVSVDSGKQTPFYYVHEHHHTAYIRMGDESVPATDYQLNELILKGRNETYDSQITDKLRTDYSFTLLEATYLHTLNQHMTESDYVSFGLATEDAHLTNAGLLFADQCPLSDSRVFCTRWNGLQKGSVHDDAADDAEYSGNLISLLKNTTEFIRRNTRKGWIKTPDSRIEKPDYAERAYFEGVVNALIHRSYDFRGTEVHVDMFDDRLVISSPGGVYGGGELEPMRDGSYISKRRNPILADVFSRLRFMERRGSGMKKIFDATKDLYGYTKEKTPFFEVFGKSDFVLTIPNVNYIHDNIHDTIHDNIHDTIHEKVSMLLSFCEVSRSREEMMEFLELRNRDHFLKKYLRPLLDQNKIEMTIPEKPRSKHQRYRTRS